MKLSTFHIVFHLLIIRRDKVKKFYFIEKNFNGHVNIFTNIIHKQIRQDTTQLFQWQRNFLAYKKTSVEIKIKIQQLLNNRYTTVGRNKSNLHLQKQSSRARGVFFSKKKNLKSNDAKCFLPFWHLSDKWQHTWMKSVQKGWTLEAQCVVSAVDMA